MLSTRFFGLLFAVPFFAIGCAATSSEDVAGSEDALHSATDCPAVIEVTIEKPTVMNDAKLLESYEREFTTGGWSDPKKEAATRLEEMKNMLTQARSSDTVVLRGEVDNGCSYKTFDKATGQKSDWYMWMRYTGSELRVSRSIAGEANHELYSSVSLTKLSKTELETDNTRDSYLYAEDTTGAHSEDPSGWRAWMGYTKITAKPIRE